MGIRIKKSELQEGRQEPLGVLARVTPSYNASVPNQIIHSSLGGQLTFASRRYLAMSGDI